MVTYGDTDGSGMDGGQWSPAQCPPPTGHPPHSSALTVIIIVCIAEKFLNKKKCGWLDTRPQCLPGRRPVDCGVLGSCSIHQCNISEQYYNMEVDSRHRPLLYCVCMAPSPWVLILVGVVPTEEQMCPGVFMFILSPLLCSFRGSICRSNKPGWIFVLNGFTSSLNFMTCYLNTSLCSLVWFCWIHLSE